MWIKCDGMIIYGLGKRSLRAHPMSIISLKTLITKF